MDRTLFRVCAFTLAFAMLCLGQGFKAGTLQGLPLDPRLLSICDDTEVLTVVTVSGAKRFTCLLPPGAVGGQANTASNLPGGTGVFANKVDVDLRFKSLVSGNSAIVLTNDANTITFTLTPSNITLQSLGGALLVSQINASGTRNSTTALFGDETWKAVALASHTHGIGDITSATDDTVAVGNGSVFQPKPLPPCNPTTEKLHYDIATNAFSCQTDATGGGVGWQESAFGDLPAAAGASGQTYVVTDAPSKSTCTAGGSTSRAPCRSNGSVWQPVLPEGSDHILMSGDQAILNPVTVPTKGHLQTFASNTITSSGAGPAYVCDVDTGATVAPPNYASIGLLLLRPHATFQASATCNVNTLGAKKLYKMSSGTPAQIGATDVDSDAAYFLIHLAALDGGAGGLLVVPMEGGSGSPDPNTVTAAGTLGANEPVVGAGGKAAAAGTRSGNTTQFATVTGTKTTGKQLAFDASGNVIASGSDIGGGGGSPAAGDVLIGIAGLAYTGDQAMVSTRVYTEKFTLAYPQTFTKIRFVYGASWITAGQGFRAAIYNHDGSTKLFETPAYTTTTFTAYTVLELSFTAPTQLAVGTYRIALTSDGTPQLTTGTFNANLNIALGPMVTYCANTSTGTGGSLAFPATCGSQTASALLWHWSLVQ